MSTYPEYTGTSSVERKWHDNVESAFEEICGFMTAQDVAEWYQLVRKMPVAARGLSTDGDLKPRDHPIYKHAAQGDWLSYVFLRIMFGYAALESDPASTAVALCHPFTDLENDLISSLYSIEIFTEPGYNLSPLAFIPPSREQLGFCEPETPSPADDNGYYRHEDNSTPMTQGENQPETPGYSSDFDNYDPATPCIVASDPLLPPYGFYDPNLYDGEYDSPPTRATKRKRSPGPSRPAPLDLRGISNTKRRAFGMARPRIPFYHGHIPSEQSSPLTHNSDSDFESLPELRNKVTAIQQEVLDIKARVTALENKVAQPMDSYSVTEELEDLKAQVNVIEDNLFHKILSVIDEKMAPRVNGQQEEQARLEAHVTKNKLQTEKYLARQASDIRALQRKQGEQGELLRKHSQMLFDTSSEE
ncbi:hypothetical protein O9K51_01520 [Purpureocillium lavendulum]|uniref:Uncharacterized protein n=1 Tax=Purpureocillium lavendulum TaxID=1247861 RepID=A0AB34G7N3_9HYPO|nr:hypothetical protein O9K51_01520 [Purpureocillium lavendulum]